MASRRRSLAWLYFHTGEDLSKAVCLLCTETIQHCGNTSNMLKHLRAKHKATFADVEAKKKQSETAAAMALLLGKFNTMSSYMAAEQVLKLSGNEMPDTDMGVVPTKQEELSREDVPSRDDSVLEPDSWHMTATSSRKRSAVWMYYQEDEDGQKALCLLCLEKLLHRRNTSNLLKHLRKRHPIEYSAVEDRMGKRQNEEGTGTMSQGPYKRSPSQDSQCRSPTKYPDILEVITVGQSEEEQLRRAQQQEVRALQRERELTQQVRRVQEQEARALERERQAVEQLRRAQEQEARALEREREALELLRRELEQDRWAQHREEEDLDADEPATEET